MSDAVTPDVELRAVLEASRRLPLCDRAAKLHALVVRVVETIDSPTPLPAIDTLASAALEALADDPWFQFNAAVERLRSARC